MVVCLFVFNYKKTVTINFNTFKKDFVDKIITILKVVCGLTVCAKT